MSIVMHSDALQVLLQNSVLCAAKTRCISTCMHTQNPWMTKHTVLLEVNLTYLIQTVKIINRKHQKHFQRGRSLLMAVQHWLYSISWWFGISVPASQNRSHHIWRFKGNSKHKTVCVKWTITITMQYCKFNIYYTIFNNTARISVCPRNINLTKM